jgi:hypothetical protein
MVSSFLSLPSIHVYFTVFIHRHCTPYILSMNALYFKSRNFKSIFVRGIPTKQLGLCLIFAARGVCQLV